MKAKVVVTKTFDDENEFSKEWQDGDFEDFFKDEGEYLDRLAKITEDKGKAGDCFVVTYTVSLVK